MVKTYICKLCNTEFSQKGHYENHVNRKNPCILKSKPFDELVAEKVAEVLAKKTELSTIYNIKDNNTIDSMNKNKIKNDEDLKQLFHGIHDYIRNHEAYYGMNALKIFNVIYTLKLLEPKVKSKEPLEYNTGLKDNEGNDIYDKHIFSDKCLFSNLVKKVKSGQKGKEDVTGLILHDILDELCSKPALRDTIFYEIPGEIKTDTFAYIIQELDRIGYDCDVGGKNYEYFVGRDPQAISELGAYFTNRPFINFIMQKINPQISDDGKIPTMMDMFGGSGGFPIMYARHMIQQAKDKNMDINWKTELSKIYHFDNNLDVVKSARIELLSLTGLIPKNFIKRHSFYSEVSEKVKYIFTNPPYGGDKEAKKKIYCKKNCKNIAEYNTVQDLPPAYCKYHSICEKCKKKCEHVNCKFDSCTRVKCNHEMIKIKNNDSKKVLYEKCNSQIKNIGIKGDNKENLSMQLMMSVLEDGGTCCAVMKEGVIFDSKFKSLREELINKYNIKYVISVPQDGFENTSTKTSVIVFEKGSKTKQVDFSELIVHKNKDNGEIEKIEEKQIITVKRKELKAKDYSLSYKKYIVNDTECAEDYEWKRLGDICEIKSGKDIKEFQNNGRYKYFGSSGIKGYCDEYQYKGDYILCGRVGAVGNLIFIENEQFNASSNVLIINDKDNLLDRLKYVFFTLQYLIDFNFHSNGSVQKLVTATFLKEQEIPIPKSKDKLNDWVEKIGLPYDLYTTYKASLKKEERIVQLMIKDMCRQNECDVHELKDLCKLERGKMIKKSDLDNGKYPVIGGGKEPMGYHSKFNREANCILVSQSGNSSGYISRYNIEVWASDCFSVRSDNDKINDNFIYYYLGNLQQKIYNYVKGNYTCQPHYNPSELGDLKIKVPKNKKLLEELEPYFEFIEKMQQQMKRYEEQYKKQIKLLGEDAIKQKDDTVSNNDETVEELEETESKSSEKKKSNKKDKIKVK